ncbi:hypothetical protein IFR05_007607 [Cadophora sp. M221]|nr:hypothetical protein IFR05_007607 [Cadophora sp. M221]
MFSNIFKLRRDRVDGDIELAQPESPSANGFPSAAALITSDPDHSFSIFPAFHKLSSRKLLYLEAELFELQKQQNDFDVQDARGDPDALQCLRSWKKFSTSSDPRQVQRLELVRRIRVTLKDYHEALALQEAVLKMGKPQFETLEALRHCLDGSLAGSNGNTAASLSGLSASRLVDENDLVALHPALERDWLSRIVDLPYLRYFRLHSDVDESIALYSMRKVNRAVAILSMILAALILIITIVTLYLVTSSNVRLGLICVFTVGFALSVHLLTNARRAELFAATAAYAAVLVVFMMLVVKMNLRTIRDETKSHVKGYGVLFVRSDPDRADLSAESRRRFLTSMSQEIVLESIDSF